MILQFVSQLGGDFFEFVRVVPDGSSGAEFTDATFGSYMTNHHDANSWRSLKNHCQSTVEAW